MTRVSAAPGTVSHRGAEGLPPGGEIGIALQLSDLLRLAHKEKLAKLAVEMRKGGTDQPASKMEDTDPSSMGDRIRAAHSVKLLQQRCNVILGRVRRNSEPAGNQLVRRTLCQQRKHLQFSGGELNVGFELSRRSGRADDKRVRLVVFSDQLEPFNVGQNGRDPISQCGVSHADRQP